MPFDLFKARAELKANWENLHDVDKAERIAQILAAGMSGRTLARSLGHSEALIRYLKPLQFATSEEKQLASGGKLSTAELLRNVKTRGEAEARKKEQVRSAQQAYLARQAQEEIVNWLASVFAPGYAEQMIDEARSLLAEAEANGKLPKDKAPAGMSFSEIMSRCEPAPLTSDEVHPLTREAFWLALGCCYAFPDGEVRGRALNLAWSTFVAAGVPKKVPDPIPPSTQPNGADSLLAAG